VVLGVVVVDVHVELRIRRKQKGVVDQVAVSLLRSGIGGGVIPLFSGPT